MNQGCPTGCSTAQVPLIWRQWGLVSPALGTCRARVGAGMLHPSLGRVPHTHGSDVKTHVSLVCGLTLSTGFSEGRNPTEYLKQVFNPSSSEIVNLERTSGFLKFNLAGKTSSDLGTKLKIRELDTTPSYSQKPLCWRPSWGPHTACQEPSCLGGTAVLSPF